MDSINQNQPEDNHQNLGAGEAIRKIKDLVDKSKTCFFCTDGEAAGSHGNGARPMAVQQVDDSGNLWFLSSADSHKNLELSEDPKVRLFFQGSTHSDFLVLNGVARASRDQAKIDELWEPIFKTWFTEGREDPRITVIQFTPTDGYYWDTKHGNLVAGIKMLVGAATGKTLDDSVEGSLRL